MVGALRLEPLTLATMTLDEGNDGNANAAVVNGGDDTINNHAMSMPTPQSPSRKHVAQDASKGRAARAKHNPRAASCKGNTRAVRAT